MARPRDIDYLQPDETIVEQARRHGLSAVDAWLGLTFVWLVLAGAAITGAVLVPAVAVYTWTVFGMVTVAWAWLMALVHWRRATSLYVITPQRVYGSHGRFRFDLTQTTYDKVTDLHLHQSIFGRIWNYGTVKVQTAGTGLALPGVRDPVRFKQIIEAERDGFLRVLVGEHRPTSRRKERKAPEVLWTGSPSKATLLGASVFSGLFLLMAIGSFIGAMLEPPVALFGALFLLMSIGIFAGSWIQYRYTAFDVTDQGVVLRKGWLSRRRVEATYAKVTDVAVNQEIVARILGYGSITINTAGSNEAPVIFAGVARPDDVKALIDEARRAA